MIIAALKPGRREGEKSLFFLHNFLLKTPNIINYY